MNENVHLVKRQALLPGLRNRAGPLNRRLQRPGEGDNPIGADVADARCVDDPDALPFDRENGEQAPQARLASCATAPCRLARQRMQADW
jgi:hypothetical protein